MMEDRNDSLSSTSELNRKQLATLRQEKAALQDELHETSQSLSDTNRKHHKLKITYEETVEQLDAARVCLTLALWLSLSLFLRSITHSRALAHTTVRRTSRTFARSLRRSRTSTTRTKPSSRSSRPS